jgi:hypothetical protein
VKKDQKPRETPEDLPFAPPDLEYLSELYIVEVPLGDEHLADRWKLRLYAEKVLEKRLGDSVQLTSMKVKKPRVVGKAKAKLLKREPVARLYVTVKF